MGRIRIRDILKQEAKRTGISIEDLVGKSRLKQVNQARQYAIWRCRKETDASLKQIGICFGNRDHTTILHAICKIDAMLPEDRIYMPEKNEVDEIKPFVIDISNLRPKRESSLVVPRPKVIFPIRPVYKVA